ncbi:MAG: RNA methyltransferase [Lachnoclostridium sp.]|nr:RNA methyltransferase [Lachnoclostridium sp.]
MQLTNNLRKSIASLDSARHRRDEGLFKVEGLKMVSDTIGRFPLRYLMVAKSAVSEVVSRLGATVADRIIPCTRQDLERMSSLTTPREVIAVYELPGSEAIPTIIPDRLYLALDDIRDPGNMGTIIRTALWMGVTDILCSRECVDLYNPKVLQSTMGAVARVNVSYCDLPEVLSALPGMEVYGTFLDGDNIYKSPLTPGGVIVVGNEGHGISPAVEACVTRRLTIPAFGPGYPGESLNAAMATGIVMSEFRRRL